MVKLRAKIFHPTRISPRVISPTKIGCSLANLAGCSLKNGLATASNYETDTIGSLLLQSGTSQVTSQKKRYSAMGFVMWDRGYGGIVEMGRLTFKYSTISVLLEGLLLSEQAQSTTSST